jgi:hypothetical protein
LKILERDLKILECDLKILERDLKISLFKRKTEKVKYEVGVWHLTSPYDVGHRTELRDTSGVWHLISVHGV